MPGNNYQPRTGNFFSDVAFLVLITIVGTVGMVWLSTLDSQDFMRIATKFSIGSFLIANLAGMVMSFKMIGKIAGLRIRKRIKFIMSGIVFLIFVIAFPLSMSYLTQYTMDQLHPALQHLRGNNA